MKDANASGINESIIEENIIVFPNPTGNFISIGCRNEWGDLQISLFNHCGQLLMNENLVVEDNNIDVSGFPEGIYLMKINWQGKEFYKKVLILR